MAGITLEIAQERLNQYLSAEAKVLLGQEVWIDGDKLGRADLAAIQKGISLWDARCRNLNAASTGLSVREVIPR